MRRCLTDKLVIISLPPSFSSSAYNLPNDEVRKSIRIRLIIFILFTNIRMPASSFCSFIQEAIRIAGSKLVLIKNVQEGKFARVLAPIAQLTIAEDQQEYIT